MTISHRAIGRASTIAAPPAKEGDPEWPSQSRSRQPKPAAGNGPAGHSLAHVGMNMLRAYDAYILN